jgi:FixJ family two-component response regulator
MPVIVTTAFGGREMAEMVRQHGATRHLEKPFRISDLAAMLSTCTHGAPNGNARG